MRARFTGLHRAGKKIRAFTPSNFAAYATAAPWFPVLDAITSPTAPRFSLSESAYNAPRTLNDPVGKSVSSFRWTLLLDFLLRWGAATIRVAAKWFARNSRAFRIVERLNPRGAPALLMPRSSLCCSSFLPGTEQFPIADVGNSQS